MVAAETEKSYFLFQLFEKNEMKNAVLASLLEKVCLNSWFAANNVGPQKAQAANTLPKLNRPEKTRREALTAAATQA